MSQKRIRKIPLKISPVFFLTAAVIGFLNSRSLIGTVVWVGIILVSVLVHEYGHALASSYFGQNPKIELIAFGGVTLPEGKKLTPGKEFLVVLMGPLFGLSLFLGAYLVARMGILPAFAQSVVTILAIVNLFWTIVNLLPVLPLDGGQLVRIILEKLMGAKAFKATLYLSIGLGALMSMAFFIYGQFFIGIIFLLLTFQNVETLRRFHYFSEADSQDDNKEELKNIELLLQQGREDEAAGRLHDLVSQTQMGLIHVVASEYLGKILYNRKEYKNTYEVLFPIQARLSKEAKSILFFVSFETKDFDRVIELSGECFSERQTPDVAIRAAAAHAFKSEKSLAIQWLKTVKKFGGDQILKVTQDALFDGLREDDDFKKIIETDE